MEDIKAIFDSVSKEERIGFVIGGILALVIAFFIFAGMWWTILWTFSFPIAFAWKNVLGFIMLIGVFGGSSKISFTKTKTKKGKK